MISINQAHAAIDLLEPLPPVSLPLAQTLGLVCAEEVLAADNCPTVDSSLKDGFAVISSDISEASPSHPVTLTVIGNLSAGDDPQRVVVTPGTAVRIMTGAPIPSGATAVLASEFAQTNGQGVTARADAQPGKNILGKGSDIAKKQVVVARGEPLGPAHLGLLAAAGVAAVTCCPRPRVGIVATGSELAWPGEPLSPGKVAASNMVIAAAELRLLGIQASTELLRDNLDNLREEFARLVPQLDLLITCGGVLDGDKDLTMRAMEVLGMQKIFHRVRIGPGKGACLGRVGQTVVFNLPGGPPSNHVALLLLALPGVRRLMGIKPCLPRKRQVLVTEQLKGQADWTQLIYARMHFADGILTATPLRRMGRLEAMARANALIEIPEGRAALEEGSPAQAWEINGGLDNTGEVYPGVGPWSPR
jgi:molybdopterin molybdotransferase